MTALSLTNEQNWANKNQFDRNEWFALYGDKFARERGEFIMALEKYALAVKRLGANDSLNFKVNDFIGDTLDATDAALAEEVRDWLGP